MPRKKKNIEPICGNCKLFNGQNKCMVVILHEGQRINLPVDPSDACFFEQTYFDPITNQEESFNDIQQVRFWVENEKGEKTDQDGIVKMEFPEGFFGNTKITDIV